MNTEIVYKEYWTEDLKSFIYNDMINCVNKLPIELRDIFITNRNEDLKCEDANVS